MLVFVDVATGITVVLLAFLGDALELAFTYVLVVSDELQVVLPEVLLEAVAETLLLFLIQETTNDLGGLSFTRDAVHGQGVLGQTGTPDILVVGILGLVAQLVFLPVIQMHLAQVVGSQGGLESFGRGHEQ